MEINYQLVRDLREVVKKVNSHINSGFFKDDKRSLESIVCNFLKKALNKNNLGEHYLSINKLKLENIAAFTDTNNRLCQIVVFNTYKYNYKGVTDLMKYLEEHITKVDFTEDVSSLDLECFERQGNNLIEKLQKFSFK